MAPRQLVRLKESRRPDSYDDQKTPAEIQQAELSASTLEELTHFVLSQIRQITGEANWFDPVQQSIKELLETRFTLPAECLATDAVGDAVYSRATDGGIYRVTKCDPSDIDKMPCFGIIISKSGDTDCTLQFGGVVSGVYGGLDLRKPLYVDTDGGLTQTLPSLAVGQTMFVQAVGMAIDDSEFLLNPSPTFDRMRGL